MREFKYAQTEEERKRERQIEREKKKERVIKRGRI